MSGGSREQQRELADQTEACALDWLAFADAHDRDRSAAEVMCLEAARRPADCTK